MGMWGFFALGLWIGIIVGIVIWTLLRAKILSRAQHLIVPEGCTVNIEIRRDTPGKTYEMVGIAGEDFKAGTEVECDGMTRLVGEDIPRGCTMYIRDHILYRQK